MRVSYRILSVEKVGLDKVYNVELTIIDTGDKTQVAVTVPPGSTLEEVLRDILISDEEVVFVGESS